jgi:hypothetical protein
LPQKYLRLKHMALNFQPDVAIIEMRAGEVLELMPKPLGGLQTARPFFLVDGNEKLVENRTYQNQWNESKEAKRMRTTAWLRRNSSLWGVIGKGVQRVTTWRNQLAAGAPKKSKASESKVVQYGSLPIDPYLKRLAKALVLQAKSDCEKQNCKLAIMYMTALSSLRHDEEEKVLTQISEELGVPMLNLRRPIEIGYLAQTDDPLNWSHLAPRGHRIVADQLDTFVKANFPSLTVSQKVSAAQEQKPNAL